MQINGKLQTVRNIRAILTSVILAIVGAAFIVLGIYLLGHPQVNEEGESSSLFAFIAIGLGAIGVIAAIFTIISAIKSIGRNKPLSEEEVRENEAKLNADAPNLPNLTDVKLFFHFGGKLNQSFFAEDKNKKVLYECRLVKFNPFGANTYEFEDVEHSYVKTIKVGKTVTTSVDGGMPFVGDTLSSRFKIDGVMCWDYLYQRGYEIKHFVLDSSSIMRYELVKLGKTVATIVLCDMKDPWDEEKRPHFLLAKGAYRIDIIDCKLEDAVMAAFIVSQSEMVE